MTTWNWSRLLARSSDGRQAIYDERFVVFDLVGASDHLAVACLGRALRPDQIVVTHPLTVRRF